MTLCDKCLAEHRATVEFAAAVIEIELAGRRKSQSAEDLRAMLPPKSPEPIDIDDVTGKWHLAAPCTKGCRRVATVLLGGCEVDIHPDNPKEPE